MFAPVVDIIGGDAPVFFMVAGPNGAGKSTYCQKRIRPFNIPCLNPDEIAFQELGHHPRTRDEARQASQQATARTRAHLAAGESVCLETVFSDTSGYKLDLLKEAKQRGHKTCLIFIGLESPHLCIARVMDRVDQGGHDVPDAMIEERFPRCFDNLVKALPLVDAALLVDNSTLDRHYEFAWIVKGDASLESGGAPAWFSERVAKLLWPGKGL